MSSQYQYARNIGLDTLRSFSVLIVLANHCFLGFFVSTGKVPWSGLNSYLSASAIISIEWLFVLSGYLLGAIMIRSFEKSGARLEGCRDFWLRRWFRTLPCYYLFLILNVLISVRIQGAGKFEFSFVVFSQNLFFPETQPHFYGESWSLALDEWFYLLMPILIFVITRYTSSPLRNSFYLASFIFISYPIVARLLVNVPSNYWEWDAQIRRITFYHLDSTGWGLLAAAINRWNPELWNRKMEVNALAGLIAIILGLACIWNLIYAGWGQSLFYSSLNAFSITLMGAGTLLILPLITKIKIASSHLVLIISSISTYSYTLYLSHFPLIIIFKFLFSLTSTTSITKLVVVSLLWGVSVLILSFFVYNFFESPVSNFRDRFTKHIAAEPFSSIRRKAV